MGKEDLCLRVPVTAAPWGGVMVVIALLLPVLVVLMLFGLDALENFLFPRHAERSRTSAGDPPKPL